MDKTQNKKIGQIGEALAARALQQKGYKILKRNWGNKWGEIDLICQDHEVVVFVEVKTKIGEEFGTPEEMINRKKLNQIQKTASLYGKAAGKLNRIDVVAVVLAEDFQVERINHYEAVSF